MRYELLLQSSVPGGPYDPEATRAVLLARGAAEEGGGLSWSVQGERVEVRPLVEGGVVIATELRVPLGGGDQFVRDMVAEGLAVAQAAGCRLFDPQIMRPLTPADAGAVAEQYARTARYAGEMAGASDVLGSAGYAAPGYPTSSAPSGGMGGQAKVFLAIAFLVALYLVVSGLSQALQVE
ncbi:MAG: hypothetical protein RL653_2366 [Pseudomonadota bacterium]